MSETLITVTEAAALLGISRGMVHHLIRTGRLTPLRLPPRGKNKGHKVYLQRTEVEQARDSWPRRHH